MDYELARRLRSQGIDDPRVLRAVVSLSRADFVPDAHRVEAFEDRPLSIGFGQTISQPYIVGFMSQALELKGDERVLEIGTGSAWQAAILGRLAREVWTIERVPELAERARASLRNAGLTNVTVRQGDGFAGWSEHAPYDAILLTAAPPRMPERLLEQLAPGGRLVGPIGPVEGNQELIRVRRSLDGELSTERLIDVRFVPMVPDEPRA